MKAAVLIDVSYTTTCMSCEESIEAGEDAWWFKGVGLWHEACPTPRSLKVYISEAGNKPKDRL